MIRNQNGRSMVEMLGVLAIIGIISIGGIAGYSMALNRQKANQLLDIANKLSVSAQTVHAMASNSRDWNQRMKAVYREFGLEGNGHDVNASTSSYETTFWVGQEGDVYIWVNEPGIQKAIESITGNSFLVINTK